jgi:hypothetical protein
MQIQQERERRNVKYNRNANAEMQIQQERERRNVKYNKNANAEMQIQQERERRNAEHRWNSSAAGIQAQQECGGTLQKKHKHGRSARTQQDAARRVTTATNLESSDK